MTGSRESLLRCSGSCNRVGHSIQIPRGRNLIMERRLDCLISLSLLVLASFVFVGEE